MVFHQAFAKSSTKVMEFTLMFEQSRWANCCLCVKCRQQLSLKLVSVDQSHFTDLQACTPGHLAVHGSTCLTIATQKYILDGTAEVWHIVQI